MFIIITIIIIIIIIPTIAQISSVKLILKLLRNFSMSIHKLQGAYRFCQLKLGINKSINYNITVCIHYVCSVYRNDMLLYCILSIQ
jgi:hypothetical protein